MIARIPPAPIEPALLETSSFIEANLNALLPQPAGPEAALPEAMRRAALGGQTRFHAFLVLQSGRLFGVDRRALGRVAAAVECLHAYAKTRDEGDATDGFSGDALLALAFGLIASPETHGDPFVRCELLAKLAAAVGHGGMIGGAVLERIGTTEAQTLPEMTRLARMKTAALIGFCCEAGAIMGKASLAMRQALTAFGQEVGQACQITAELAAYEHAAVSGAPAGLVALLGEERARAQAEALADQAVVHLDSFDEKADLLRAAASFVLEGPI